MLKSMECGKLLAKKKKKIRITLIYTEIPEPAQSLYQHGAQTGGPWGFPVTKITAVHQVCMSLNLAMRFKLLV